MRPALFECKVYDTDRKVIRVHAGGSLFPGTIQLLPDTGYPLYLNRPDALLLADSIRAAAEFKPTIPIRAGGTAQYSARPAHTDGPVRTILAYCEETGYAWLDGRGPEGQVVRLKDSTVWTVLS